MIKEKKILIVAETHLGIHAEIAKHLGWELVAFTFRPSFYSISVPIKKIEDDTHVPVSIIKNFKFSSYGDDASKVLVDKYFGDPVAMIKAYADAESECMIFLLHDADEGGDVMASFLKYHLETRGYPNEKIVRIASLEIRGDKLLILQDPFFYSKEHLRLILETIREGLYSMNVHPRIGVGLRKAAALKAIEDALKSEEVVSNNNSNGTGISTYITKYLLGENF